jgi:hypothetical protein
VLDARRHNVDLDRGEVLPLHRMGDLRRMAFLTGTDIRKIGHYIWLPEDFEAPIDAAGVGLVARAYGDMHRRRAQKIWLEIPDPDGPQQQSRANPDRRLIERAQREADMAERWTALSRAVLGQQHAGWTNGPTGCS